MKKTDIIEVEGGFVYNDPNGRFTVGGVTAAEVAKKAAKLEKQYGEVAENEEA